jgi:hypothetical protein
LAGLNHPQPPFIPIDLDIDETMDGTMQAVGRAMERTRRSTHEADRAAILMTYESARIRSIGAELHFLARRRPASGVNGIKPAA